jgi:hypothetical protein
MKTSLKRHSRLRVTTSCVFINADLLSDSDHLCGLVVRFPGCRLKGLGFDSPALPERDPLSLVTINEELLERQSDGFGLENWLTAVGVPLRWPRTKIRRPVAVTQSAEFTCGLKKATELLGDSPMT